jgi:hypothetical protein
MKEACRAMLATIQSQWGRGWDLLGADIKRAVIAERVLYSFAGCDESIAITPAMITARLDAMREYCKV